MKKLLYDICRVALILYLVQVMIIVLCWLWPLDMYLFQSWRVIIAINSTVIPIVLAAVLLGNTPEKEVLSEEEIAAQKQLDKERW